MSWPNKPVNGKWQSQQVVIYVIPSFSAGDVGEAGVETEEATNAGAGACFFLFKVVRFPKPEVAFRAVFAVTSFAAASFSAGTFTGFFLAPTTDLEDIEKEL